MSEDADCRELSVYNIIFVGNIVTTPVISNRRRRIRRIQGTDLYGYKQANLH
jgi:hypothetical protein